MYIMQGSGRNKSKKSPLLYLYIWIVILAASSCTDENRNPVEPASLPPVSSHESVLMVRAAGGIREYSLNQLEQLGLKRLSTSTFWPSDDGIYEGILLSDLLKNCDLDDVESLRLTAYDGYTLAMPRSLWEDWPVLLATRRDGETMELKEKGPTRIIFPRDMDKSLKSETARSFWIWSLKTIEEEK